MKVAVISDIHANRHAFEATLEAVAASDAAELWCLGDLVGYGAEPQRVVETVMRYAAEGAVVVKGNHDAAVEKIEAGMSDGAAETRDWTRGALDAAAKDWLRALPLCVREDRICFVHASAAAPGRWEYVSDALRAQKSIDAAGTTYTVSGHVHDQVLYFEATPGQGRGKVARFGPVPGSAVPVPGHRRWLAIVGSVGQPRDRNPAAAYALFDLAREHLTFHRVPYDHLAAARKVRAVGLPDLSSWGGPR
jgi:diadenosine tetraphosphatase ApaH/serine/threonine PP2A family protein phosphatase